MVYSKAKKLHPNLKVRNAKRLIEAIRKSEPSPDHFTMPPAESGGKIVRRFMLRTDGSLTRSGDRLHIYFDMTFWINAVRASATPPPGIAKKELFYEGESHEPVCGTAACIAGFAYILQARDAAKKGTRAKYRTMAAIEKMTRGEDHEKFRIDMLGALENFLGVDQPTALRMSDLTPQVHGLDESGWGHDYNSNVEPRHAARMLEIFLETGFVEWKKAMGRKLDGALTRAEVNRRRKTHKFKRDRVRAAQDMALAAHKGEGAAARGAGS